MNKITLKSLELAGFKNASQLAEIIATTPNARVSAEILLGIYEPVSVEDFGSYWKHSYRDTIYQVLSIDELRDFSVCYEHKQKTEQFYYLTSEDYESKINRVAKADKVDGVKYYNWHSEAVPGVTTNQETFKLEQFNDSLKPMTYDEFVAYLIKWDPFVASMDKWNPATYDERLPF